MNSKIRFSAFWVVLLGIAVIGMVTLVGMALRKNWIGIHPQNDNPNGTSTASISLQSNWGSNAAQSALGNGERPTPVHSLVGELGAKRSKAVTSQSGDHAEISSDGRSVSFRDGTGKTNWTTDIVASFGTNVPMYFTGRIDYLEIHNNVLVLYAGNEFIILDQQDGRIMRREAR